MAKPEIEDIKDFSQTEYNRILDAYEARENKLKQNQCEGILKEHGANDGQARNGAYIYLFHGGNTNKELNGNKGEYKRLLDKFNAYKKTNKECIQYLKSLGYNYGQAKSAAYAYRKENGLTHQ